MIKDDIQKKQGFLIIDKKFWIIFIVFFLIQLIPFVFLSESFIANSSLLQSFISYISSFVPGVQNIPKVTYSYPNTMSLQLALFWVEVFISPLLVIFLIKNNPNRKLASEEEKIKVYFAFFVMFLMSAWFIIGLYNGNLSIISKKLLRMIERGYGLIMFDALLLSELCVLTFMLAIPKIKFKVEGENND